MLTQETATNPLLALDPILGPTAKAHLGSAPQALIFALLGKSHRHKIPAQMVRVWIKSRLNASRPDAIPLLKASSWKLITEGSDRWWTTVQSVGSSALAPRAARRGLARVLSKMEDTKKVSGHKQVQIRHTAAVISLEAVRVGHAGKETTITTDPWLGVQRGIERSTARSHRNLLFETGWLKLVAGGRAGYPARVRFARLPAAVSAVVDGEAMYATVGQIASQDDDQGDLLAALYGSAAHPAWTYSPAHTSAHWLVAVADVAGVDPVELGVNTKRVFRIRKEVVALLGEHKDAKTVNELLDDHAISVGAFQAFEAAEEARRIAAAERKAEVEAVRAEKQAAAQAKTERTVAERDAKTVEAKQARHPVDVPVETVEQQGDRLAKMLIMEKVGALPEQTGGKVRPWLDAAEPLLKKCTAPQRMAIANALYSQLVGTGWEPGKAGSFAQIIAGESAVAA